MNLKASIRRLAGRGRPGKNGTHPVDLFLNSRSASTARSYRNDLNYIAKALTHSRKDAHGLDWSALDYRDDLRLRGMLEASGLAPSSINRRLVAYRQLMKAMRRMRLLTGDRAEEVRDLESVSQQQMPAGRSLSATEVDRILEWCSKVETAKGVRDAALVATMYGSGVRRCEAVGLDLDDYRPGSEPELVVRKGKGKKQRGLDLKPSIKRRIDAWLALRGDAPGALFCPVDQTGRVYVGRLHPQTVTDIIRDVVRGSGVKPFTPHDLRRTFATHLRDAGVPIEVTAALMGHSSITITARYYRNDQAYREAARKLPGGEA